MVNSDSRRAGLVVLGIGLLDVIVGLFWMPFLLLYGTITFVAGLLYFILGVALLFRKLYLKLLFFGVLPFTLLHTIVILVLSEVQDSSNYFRMTVENRIFWTIPLLLVCLLNLYCLTRPHIQQQCK